MKSFLGVVLIQTPFKMADKSCRLTTVALWSIRSRSRRLEPTGFVYQVDQTTIGQKSFIFCAKAGPPARFNFIISSSVAFLRVSIGCLTFLPVKSCINTQVPDWSSQIVSMLAWQFSIIVRRAVISIPIGSEGKITHKQPDQKSVLYATIEESSIIGGSGQYQNRLIFSVSGRHLSTSINWSLNSNRQSGTKSSR